ncbi:MAG: SMC-Scp complex subunit ScpB [Pseudohongiellaceae bacterium]
MSDVDNKVKMIIEGLLLSAGRPLSLDNITAVFSEDEKPGRQELKAVMEAIAEDCDDRGFELKEVASGFRFQVKQELSEWVAKLWEERPPRYTRALLETLALIAYRQPITRGDIEEIRGVAVSANIIRTLLDREWIRVVGHRDVPGRPAMFATTKQFLDYFNLKSLQELPPLAEIKDLDSAAQELDLDDELSNQRVIDLPEESVDENSVELSDGEKAEMLAEEEAIELAKKPLDEILNLDPARASNDGEPEAGAGQAGEDDSAPNDFGAADTAVEQSSANSDTESADESEPGANQDGEADDSGETAAPTSDDTAEDTGEEIDDDLAAADEILAEYESVGDEALDSSDRFDATEADNPDADDLSPSPAPDEADGQSAAEPDDESADEPISRTGSK